MIIIRFPDIENKHKALGYLPGRFTFTSWATGEMLVPEAALSHLGAEGIRFTVEGPPTYEQRVTTLRGAAASPVQ
jgi:hypothetical protein